MTNATATLTARFWDRVDFTSSELGCWLWTGTLAGGGYGYPYINGRSHYAHRLTYQQVYGEIAKGLEIDHLCRVRNCVNPSHLEAVHKAENVARGVSPSAQAGRQTHCLRGHSLSDPANVYQDLPSRPRTRTCKPCAVQRARDLRARKRG